jgi:hypothetical protein
VLVTSQPGKDPHQDAGVEVRRSFHKLRSKTIEPFNRRFKTIFEWGGPVPVRVVAPHSAGGLRRSFALPAGLAVSISASPDTCEGH